MKYEHELAMQKAKHKQSDKSRDGMNVFSKVPKLSIFQDENDNIDTYLEWFGSRGQPRCRTGIQQTMQ